MQTEIPNKFKHRKRMNWRNKYFGFIVVEGSIVFAALIASTAYYGFLHYFIMFNFIIWGLIALQRDWGGKENEEK